MLRTILIILIILFVIISTIYVEIKVRQKETSIETGVIHEPQRPKTG